MNFEQTYRSMNERIGPDSALVADTLARMGRGEKPRHRPRRLRRMIAAAAAAAVAVGHPRWRQAYPPCIRRCMPQLRSFSFRSTCPASARASEWR